MWIWVSLSMFSDIDICLAFDRYAASTKALFVNHENVGLLFHHLPLHLQPFCLTRERLNTQ